MLSLPFADPSLYEALPTSSLGWVDVPDNGRKRGELVMFTPEKRRAVDHALTGFLSQYGRMAAWDNW
jgi:hypothetical protein